MAERGRSTFFPTVVAGLAGGALAAVGSSKVWVSHELSVGGRPSGVSLVGSDIGKLPLAAALSFVLLAGWGVLLVTRGVVRRVLSVLVVLVALGLLACVVFGGFHLADDVRDVYVSQTATGARLSTGFTGWYWASAVAVVVSLLAGLVAVRFAGVWPEMGSRYDAPGAAKQEQPIDPDDPDAGNRAMWKAMDEGEDPTLGR